MKPRTPVEKLTVEEAAAVRSIADAKGPEDMAKELGLNRTTVANAAAGFSIHRMSVRLLRLYLQNVEANGQAKPIGTVPDVTATEQQAKARAVL